MSSKGRNVRLTLFCAAVAGAVLALAVGCQTYDFEPVQPLAVSQRTQTKTITARNLKPDMFLLVDSSGSMVDAANPSDPNCATPDGGVCGAYPSTSCPSTCSTRWQDLQTAMGGFLSTSGTVARMGQAFFPADGNACGATTQLSVPFNTSNDDPTSLQQTADAIKAAIDGKSPGGGTPTNLSLAYVGQQYAAIDTANRQNFVLLLTDGLPNCNSTLDPATCTCTEATCASAQLCLDDNGTVNEITQLATNGIKTIVIGFGADTTTGTASQVLTAMATAGGFPKSCPNGTDAECGANDTCNTTTKVCNKPFFQASNATELSSVLAAIGASFVGDPCVFALDEAPSDPNLLSVIVNGTETPSGPDTWTYQNQAVVFQGALCTAIKNSNNSNPYKIQVQVVQSL